MLAMSSGHQLFFNAYSDFDDLNENGVVWSDELTYDNRYEYVGYFDSRKCYAYRNNRFEPVRSMSLAS